MIDAVSVTVNRLDVRSEPLIIYEAYGYSVYSPYNRPDRRPSADKAVLPRQGAEIERGNREKQYGTISVGRANARRKRRPNKIRRSLYSSRDLTYGRTHRVH